MMSDKITIREMHYNDLEDLKALLFPISFQLERIANTLERIDLNGIGVKK